MVHSDAQHEERPSIWCWTSGEKGVAEPVSPERAAVAGWGRWGEELSALGPWRSAPAPWSPKENGLLAPGDDALPPVVVVGPCASALDVAWKMFSSASPWCAPDFASILAVSQSAGRGQLRRAWASPPENLHVVLRWPNSGVLAGPLAFLAAGLAMAETLTRLGAPIQLKWPNDLLHEGKKVGGLLVEERGGAMVVGMGVNLGWAPSPNDLREGHAVTATSLGWPGGPLHFWLRALPQLVLICNTLQWLEPDELCAMAERRLAWLNQTVRLRNVQVLDGTDFDNSVATIVGVGVDGSLRVLANGREHSIVAAELRPDIAKPS